MNFNIHGNDYCKDAIDESDLQKLPEKLAAAEGAIFLRWQELSDSHRDHEESEALRQASRELLKIQTERLKWPIPGGIVRGGSDCSE